MLSTVSGFKISKSAIDVVENKSHEPLFLIEQQEQYSRKNSVRVFDLTENDGENLEELCFAALKEEIAVDIAPNEIEIILCFSCALPNKP